MSAPDRVPENAILDYLQRLITSKKGLPHGEPVCVMVSHTVNDAATLIRLVSEIGPHIALLQVQADIIDDWSDHVVDQLTYFAKRHGFILWEGSRMLNNTVNFMGRGSADWETSKGMADLITRKYTHGPTKPARWANMANSWAPGVPCDEQEKDVLIPTLRRAAREAVAKTVKTIQTEISAEESDDIYNDEEVTFSPPSSNGWHEFSPTMGSSLRKSSTISVTETTTLQPHIQPEDGVPPPPLLARGLTLCLPNAIDTAFTYEFRQSTIVAACANPDFVLGLLTSEPFFPNDTGNDILELAFTDGSGGSNMRNGSNPLTTSPYLEKDNLMGLFSLLPFDYSKEFESDPSFNMDGDHSSDTQPLSVTKLFYIIGRAAAQRAKSRKERQASNGHPKSPSAGPRILQVPIAILP
ncbi:hypothetical protein N7512_006840 [Penicillium capsulatum]|nr:hypothetical protein N7512_006840 [Penicillium capsulatum]